MGSAKIKISDFEEDYYIVDDELIAYLGDSEEVSIPEGVKKIGAGAFQKNETITKVVMSESVTTIGNYAFASCTELETKK